MKKAERLVKVIILCLCGYLLYEIYQPQVDYWIKKLKQEHPLQTDETAKPQAARETQKDTAQAENDEGELPAVYDGRKAGRAPKVKSQGQLGTCWAVSTSSALEAALLPEEQEEFSPDHISLQNGYEKTQEDGGAYTMAMAYLAAWKGPVREEDDPYGDGVSPEGLLPVRHVQEMQMIQDKDYKRMKEAVYAYGAVQSSIYMDMQGTQYTSIYYNEANASYCYTGEEAANHDVLVIGWDDNYPAENFVSDVKEDGAFICQNSWGTSFGEEGIFYVSYEDAVIGENCVTYTRVEPTDNYDKLYQSDLCGWVGQLGYDSEVCWFANVYTAGETNEQVKAAGFYATGANTEYEILAVREFEGEESLLGAESIQTGTIQNPGYYTVDLKEPFEVLAGQKFAMVIKIKTPGESYPVATEYQADENTRYVDLSDGMGYISLEGYHWTNTEEIYGCNLCLKVYTCRVSES